LAAILRAVSGLFCGEDVRWGCVSGFWFPVYGEYEFGVSIIKNQELKGAGLRSDYLAVEVKSTQGTF
jgi:hypothetical protein